MLSESRVVRITPRLLKDLTKYWMIVMGENWHWEFLGYQVYNSSWGKSGRKDERSLNKFCIVWTMSLEAHILCLAFKNGGAIFSELYFHSSQKYPLHANKFFFDIEESIMLKTYIFFFNSSQTAIFFRFHCWRRI